MPSGNKEMEKAYFNRSSGKDSAPALYMSLRSGGIGVVAQRKRAKMCRSRDETRIPVMGNVFGRGPAGIHTIGFQDNNNMCGL